jgi:hypothetical protein
LASSKASYGASKSSLAFGKHLAGEAFRVGFQAGPLRLGKEVEGDLRLALSRGPFSMG